MNSRSTRFFFEQSCSSCICHVNWYIIIAVSLLEISSKSHDKEALKRYMLFFTELKKSWCRLLFQMVNIKCRFHMSWNECRRPCVFVSLSLGNKRSLAVNSVINWLWLSDYVLKILSVLLLCLAVSFVFKILLKLLYVGTHFLRIRDTFIHSVTVKFNNVSHEEYKRLRIGNKVIDKNIYTLTSIRHFNHNNSVHRRVLHVKWDSCPRCHHCICLFHCVLWKIEEFNVSVFFFNNILEPLFKLWIVRKANTHRFASFNRLVNWFFQHVKVKLIINSKTRSDIYNLFLWALVHIIKMKRLRPG